MVNRGAYTPLTATNGLKGNLPDELCMLGSLETHNFGFNSLSGSIPACLAELSNMKSLSMNLKDELPEGLFLVESLSQLNLADNQLSGSLGRLFQGSGSPSTSLESCNLHSNKFTGVIPPEFGSMTGP